MQTKYVEMNELRLKGNEIELSRKALYTYQRDNSDTLPMSEDWVIDDLLSYLNVNVSELVLLLSNKNLAIYYRALGYYKANYND